MCIPHHGPDDVLHEVHIAKATRSAVPLHDLLDRTSEVDIDEVRAEEIRYQRRSFAHRLGGRPKNLDPDRPFVLAEPEMLTSLPVSLHDTIGAHELGRYHVGTEPSAKPAERSFAHSRLGREEERRSAARHQLEDSCHVEKGRVRRNKGEGPEGCTLYSFNSLLRL